MENTAQFSEDLFMMSGTGHLSVKNGVGGVVCLSFVAVDGRAPTNGKVFGDRELLEQAWQAGHATLAMLNKTFRVKVIAKNETIGAVEIASAISRAARAHDTPALIGRFCYPPHREVATEQGSVRTEGRVRPRITNCRNFPGRH